LLVGHYNVLDTLNLGLAWLSIDGEAEVSSTS
jgi:hypothetical protein